MKKNIFAIATLFLGLSLFGCNKGSNDNTGSSNFLQQKAPSITGTWQWTSKAKNGIEASKGIFNFNEAANGNAFQGASKIIIYGIKAIPGKGGNPKAQIGVISSPIVGIRKVNELEFNTKNPEGLLVYSKAKVENNKIIGKTYQQLTQQGAKDLGFQIDYKSLPKDKNMIMIDYDWEAEKIK